MVAEAGDKDRDPELVPLAKGANNRVFLVETQNGRYIAKWYYDHPDDSRDRLQAELAFTDYARAIGLRCVPRALGYERAARLALYEYVEGRPFTAADVSESYVLEAAAFFAELNRADNRFHAQKLPPASEACFDVQQHLRMVDERLERLAKMPIECDVDREAAAFVDLLGKRWQRERERLLSHFPEIQRSLPEQWRCISPSDFGFHNAILRPDGQVCFHDFEYAGWDDPAKMIGDFFLHPGVPIPARFFDSFVSQALAPFAERERLVIYARRLEAVFRVKWCCIVLNEFHPVAALRRRFADPDTDFEARKRAQLEKARAFFAQADRG